MRWSGGRKNPMYKGGFSQAVLPRVQLVIGLVALLAAGIPLAAQQKPASMTETMEVGGLKRPVEILVDHWGVPHIYAENEADLFFAQGFNAARDRMFQMDLWRRRGLGELAEVFGPQFVEPDTATRLFLYRGDMKKEWSMYSPDAQEIAARFAAGVNAYVDWLTAHPEQMPYEFKTMKYEPGRWSKEDVVRIRSHGLSGNLLGEVERAKVVCAAGWKAEEIRQRLEPAWQTRVPDGLDPCLPKDVLKVFALATVDVKLALSSLKAELSPTLEVAEARVATEGSYGSNNWVISAGKSATGRAILASDPHRAYMQPSIRYIADLNAPTLHIEGVGEPIAPGVSFAHNDWIAYAGTIFRIDQEDLYAYELNPANAEEYKYEGKWETFRVVHEEIKVKGQNSSPVELKFTRHGPVIYVEKEKNRAFAVRTAWLEPGTSPYYASVALMRSKTFEEFEKAVERWKTPPLNIVYADVKGNIGWTPRGFAPIRPNWDGLLPVPGDGKYEWSGQWSGAQLPRSYNPNAGYFTTSNQMDLPADYPYKERRLGFEWSNPSRHQRIEEVLSKRTQVSLEDSMRLQNDVVSIPARRLVALLQPLMNEDAKMQAALKLLKGWDGSLDMDSAAAALEEVWFSRHLEKAFKEAVLSKEDASLFDTPSPTVMLEALEHPETRFSGNATEQRDKLLLTTIAAAYVEMESLEGTDPREWRWGKLHHNLSEHAFSGVVDEAARKALNVGPIETGGSGFTVNASPYRASDFLQVGGPSVRMVLEVGNWDNSRAVNHPGQSGAPESAHYRALAPMWRAGTYFPLLYSRKAVEEATERRIRLVPKEER
jgi:penicillin amidase